MKLAMTPTQIRAYFDAQDMYWRAMLSRAKTDTTRERATYHLETFATIRDRLFGTEDAE